jgi:hypothetical protein
MDDVNGCDLEVEYSYEKGDDSVGMPAGWVIEKVSLVSGSLERLLTDTIIEEEIYNEIESANEPESDE